MSVVSSAAVPIALAGWYKQLRLEDVPATITARLEGINVIAKTYSKAQVEALIRLAFSTNRAPSSAEVEKIRQVFTEADDTFPQAGNNLELQILAAACLIHMMEINQSPSIVALFINATSCAEIRKPKLPMDLITRANSTLSKRSEINRKRTAINTDFPELESADLSVAVKAVRDQQNWEGVATAIEEVESVIDATFDEYSSHLKLIFELVNADLTKKDEELDMLWWLTGQRSGDLDCAFDAVTADAQPLIFAKELADLTTVRPGPSSIQALLSRAGLKDKKKIKLAVAVNAVSSEWMQQYFRDVDYSPVTTPIHYALQRRLENEGEEWAAGWASVTGISAEQSLSPLALGLQFYRERILLKWS
ncbi:hypothetical protein NC77_20335 [Janthinobacterium lividum]|uniref:GTPase-associated system all-helical protein GASH n=1 Tax=Janthinobacterium lividum TaxID=29581 RepID=UPI000538613D|nr:GTPase-associated system all-helical protein GASH [Janthinobacterium lividum]KHA77240.1 hypothetical protein NC77_20335 [Janthinobacterium lividum]